ncbi:MAG: DUF1080 domain-containing protein, partial [Candidatus Omnitrophota bacterium]|nr:DUF1080 domain-containing protein [Candidatus Omnitrophota bacterium]
MKKITNLVLISAVSFLCIVSSINSAFAVTPTPPQIGAITDSGTQVPKYEIYEATFQVANIGTHLTDYNAFNPNINALSTNYWDLKGIQVDAVITSPNGQIVKYPCFWYEGTDGWKGWKLRFAPTLTGGWSYYITVKHAYGTASSSAKTFTCVNSTGKGFIKVSPSDPRVFEFSDGTPFYPFGVCDSDSTYMPKIAANGGNFTRFYYSSLSLEPYSSSASNLNRFSMSSCRTIDTLMQKGKDNGVYIQWLLDDWEKVKGNTFPYITSTSRPGPCATTAEFAAGVNRSREIYKRKLRYFIARWGAYRSLVSIEFINELDMNSTDWLNWHKEMGNFVHGNKSYTPAEWALPEDLSYTNRTVMATSSNGSGWMDDRGIPWGDSSMDYFNEHDYAKFTLGWASLQGAYNFEKMGSTQDYPWEDAAVWMDRCGKAWQKNYTAISGWKKPHCFTEFGLIYRRPGDGGFPDWQGGTNSKGAWQGLAYDLDTTARHYREALWAGVFRYIWMTHWKKQYIDGTFGAPGEKYWIFKPLRHFIEDEDLRGMVQETAYPGVTPIKLECSNTAKIQAMVLVGNNKALLYVKNLTDDWYRIVNDPYHASPPPIREDVSGTIKIHGLSSGTAYQIDKWKTYEPDKTKQIAETFSRTADSSGTISFTVSMDAANYDYAYKIYTGGGSGTDITPPSVPQGLKSTTVTDTTIGISWTTSTDNVAVTGYRVYRDNVKVAEGNYLTFSDSGRTANTTYTYAVSAYDAAGNESARSTALPIKTNATLDTIAPTVPQGLMPTTTTDSSIALSWTASTDNVAVTGYRVYRDAAVLANIATTSYTNTGLSPDTIYSYAVAAYDAAGNVSDHTVPLSIRTGLPPDTAAPSIPQGLTATSKTDTSISITWIASTDNMAVTGYRIYRDGVKVADSSSLAFDDPGRTANTTYAYTVSAYDAAGNVSAQSIALSVKTNPPPDTAAPSVPQGLTATSKTYNSVSLAWSASTDNVGVIGYRLYRNNVKIYEGSTLAYADSGRTASTAYTYTVTAYDAAGNVSGASIPFIVQTNPEPDITPPTVPQSLRAVLKTYDSISLAWNASTDKAGVDGYKVYRNNTLVADISNTGYIDTGLSSDTAYNYAVSAYDVAGNESAKCASVAIRTDLLSAHILMEDNFTDGDSNGWTIIDETTVSGPSVWKVASGELVQSTNIGDVGRKGTYALCSSSATWTDYEVTMRLKSTDDDNFGLIFRRQDSNNFYLFTIDAQNSKLILLKKSNGVLTTLGEVALAGYSKGQWSTLKVRVAGDHIHIFLAGQIVFDEIDTSDPILYGGIGLYSCYAQGAYFDDV